MYIYDIYQYDVYSILKEDGLSGHYFADLVKMKEVLPLK